MCTHIVSNNNVVISYIYVIRCMLYPGMDTALYPGQITSYMYSNWTPLYLIKQYTCGVTNLTISIEWLINIIKLYHSLYNLLVYFDPIFAFIVSTNLYVIWDHLSESFSKWFRTIEHKWIKEFVLNLATFYTSLVSVVLWV